MPPTEGYQDNSSPSTPIDLPTGGYFDPTISTTENPVEPFKQPLKQQSPLPEAQEAVEKGQSENQPTFINEIRKLREENEKKERREQLHQEAVDINEKRNEGFLNKDIQSLKPHTTQNYQDFIKDQETISKAGKEQENDRLKQWNKSELEKQDRQKEEIISKQIEELKTKLKNQSEVINKQSDNLNSMINKIEELEQRLESIENEKRESNTPSQENNIQKQVPIIKNLPDNQYSKEWKYEYPQGQNPPIENEQEQSNTNTQVQEQEKSETTNEREQQLISLLAKMLEQQAKIEISLANSAIIVTLKQKPKEEIPDKIKDLTDLSIQVIFEKE